jgi:hypothetical protein
LKGGNREREREGQTDKMTERERERQTDRGIRMEIVRKGEKRKATGKGKRDKKCFFKRNKVEVT